MKLKNIATIAIIILFSFSTIPLTVNAEEQHTYTILQINEILTGLSTLSDGYTALDADKKQVKLQYRLGATRIAIATNMTLLRNILKAADEARVDLIKKYLPETQPSPGTPEWNTFTQSEGYKNFTSEYTKMMNSPPPGVKVELARIKVKDLNIGDSDKENAISPVILTQIEPILDH